MLANFANYIDLNKIIFHEIYYYVKNDCNPSYHNQIISIHIEKKQWEGMGAAFGLYCFFHIYNVFYTSYISSKGKLERIFKKFFK